MSFSKQTLKTSCGLRLVYRYHQANTDRRILVFHGYGEHGEDYVGTMERLFPEGDVSWAILDRRGSGESEGSAEDLASITLLKDVDLLRRELGWPEGGFVGLGHSFGGLALLEMIKERPSLCQAIILSSPFLGMSDEKTPFEITLYLTIANLFPKFKITDPVPPQHLTHDEVRIKKYLEDSRVRRYITLGALKKIHKKQARVSTIKSLPVPLLVLRAGEERVVSQKRIEEWYHQCAAPLKDGKIFPGLHHELYNELNNESVFEITRTFLEKIWLR